MLGQREDNECKEEGFRNLRSLDGKRESRRHRRRLRRRYRKPRVNCRGLRDERQRGMDV